MRSEAASLVGVCHAFELIAPNTSRSPGRDLPSVARGERLCAAYEMYRSLVPESAVSLDHLILLVVALSHESEIEVGQCTGCGGIVVMDRFGDRRHTCPFCLDAGCRDEALLALSDTLPADAAASA